MNPVVKYVLSMCEPLIPISSPPHPPHAHTHTHIELGLYRMLLKLRKIGRRRLNRHNLGPLL